MPEPKTPWPHAPTHQLAQRGTYFITASTHFHAHHFRGAKRLGVLHRGLLTVAERFGWRLEAWAVFSNHYHFVGHSPANALDATSLPAMLSTLHVKTAGWVNKLDGQPGRQVWFNFRDTRLTHQRSYLARLNYVHQNAVKHGLVPVANQYPWCSAGWLERTASPAMVKSIYRFKTDRISVEDDFQPAPRVVIDLAGGKRPREASWSAAVLRRSWAKRRARKRQRAGAVQDAAARLGNRGKPREASHKHPLLGDHRFSLTAGRNFKRIASISCTPPHWFELIAGEFVDATATEAQEHRKAKNVFMVKGYSSAS